MPQPPGNGRKTRHKERRAELLEAATDYVFDHGLAELSLRPLSAALGVSHRTLLYHFGSKELLFMEILARGRARERRVLARGREAAGAARLPDLLRLFWGRFTSPEQRAFFRFHFDVHGLALQDPERFGSYMQKHMEDWVGGIQLQLIADGVPEDRSRALASFVYAAIRGLQDDLWTTDDSERVEAAFEEFLTVVERIEEPAER